MRLAVLCDYPEEGWASMDLVAEMLLREAEAHAGRVRAVRFCSPFRRRFGRLPWLGRRAAAFNADRLVNRVWDYPRRLRRRAAEFDLFHVCDHSYAQLVHVLPADRTGVHCHDLDAFRCLLGPRPEPRPLWFRAVARGILRGLQKAAVVFYSTQSVREEITAHGLLDPDRLVHAPYGVAPEFAAGPADGEARAAADGRPFLLHVGSCIPRKRIDVLLDVFAAVRGRRPDLALVQVGGQWTAPQQQQAARLGIAPAVVQVRGLTRGQLAALYRAAALVLQPSEAEGFGLPVIEALACGAVVVASDLPVLREVGEGAVVYCPVADVDAWCEAIVRLLAHPDSTPPRAARLAQARRYTWAAFARTVVENYERRLRPGIVGPSS
jgi:glycosyltransferase involved in cell wall biosynthesis